MVARKIIDTCTIHHGTEQELKKIKGKTIDKRTALSMIKNEYASRFALDIPDDHKCVLVISYQIEKPDLIKTPAEKKAAAMAQRRK